MVVVVILGAGDQLAERLLAVGREGEVLDVSDLLLGDPRRNTGPMTAARQAAARRMNKYAVFMIRTGWGFNDTIIAPALRSPQARVLTRNDTRRRDFLRKKPDCGGLPPPMPGEPWLARRCSPHPYAPRPPRSCPPPSPLRVFRRMPRIAHPSPSSALPPHHLLHRMPRDPPLEMLELLGT